ncbi:MAG: 3-hydroxyacyl-CoA dehydrogenase family protein [Labilithrix sp.]|nr:3-hydroxyacyl-CoA dehydrogenase family protein [Labilithrix sp.]MCW5810050.1 3-hydroxyacyl-CoA dehydrogenase family protein [Labilithrix sp.]
MSTISLTVTVLGTGTMGQGIAQVTAQSGHTTRVFDAAEGRAKAAVGAIAAQFEKLVGKGKITNDVRAGALNRLSAATTAADACAGADVVIEAIPEDMALKIAVLSEVLPHADKNALVASNTSSLSITELGAKLAVAPRTIGLHFFNPPPVMELVEVVRGLATSEDTLARSLGFVKSLGKTPIVVRDVPGFATSRLGVILGCEAMRMLEAGVASAADIDRGMELGYRHPMGPLKLTDLVGLDVRLAILDHLTKEIGEQFRPPPLLRTMVRAGKLGKKTGEGFYKWVDGQAVIP